MTSGHVLSPFTLQDNASNATFSDLLSSHPPSTSCTELKRCAPDTCGVKQGKQRPVELDKRVLCIFWIMPLLKI